jgi:hypothetical protein
LAENERGSCYADAMYKPAEMDGLRTGEKRRQRAGWERVKLVHAAGDEAVPDSASDGFVTMHGGLGILYLPMT